MVMSANVRSTMSVNRAGASAGPCSVLRANRCPLTSEKLAHPACSGSSRPFPSVRGVPGSRDGSSRASGSELRALFTPEVDIAETDDGLVVNDSESFAKDYGHMTALDIARQRAPWLAIFCIGLVVAADVVKEFDELIAQHVELSFFVPLIMGHGGNAGSQTTCAIVRALALKQVSFRQTLTVVGKEAAAGALMGTALGAGILALALGSHAVSPEVGIVVAVSMPAISLWANGLGAFLTLSSAKLGLDPAMTSAPLVTTVVDSTALIIYFKIAHQLIQDGWLASMLSSSSVLASILSPA